METEKLLRDAELLLDLAEHEGMKLLLEEMKQLATGINNQLLFKVELTEMNRARLLASREALEWIQHRFVSAKEMKDKYEQTGTTSEAG